MCGIAGCTQENRQMIERMTSCLVHRGPDGNAVWTGHGASLGHARLAILDPRPDGNQPMWNDAGTIVIVYNGEIYNFRELRDEEGFDSRTETDTEVILRLFEQYGMDFVSRLRGMFAFAIYDTRKRSMHLARDTSGIKPLFVAYPGGNLHFASEMRSLMQAFGTKPPLNMQSLSLYLRLQYVPGPRTLCEGIEQLPPGTILEWKDGKESRRSFSAQEELPVLDKALFEKTFPDIMDAAVRRHMISDKPLGIFLSGGMDSSILLHHMVRHAEKPVATFTVRFDATEEEGAKRFNTDADLARLTAQHYGTDHHEILLSARLYKDLYSETARSLDQPNANAVAVAQVLLSREAKKYVDVVLYGAGGDELFGGYPRYRIAHILRTLRAVPAPLRSAAGRITGYPADVLALQPGPMLAERLLARPVRECTEIVREDWFDPLATTTLFTERYAHLPHSDPVRSFMEFDRGLWLVDESLRLADATTMSAGLEARVPFLDPAVIAASHATKSAWHVTHRSTKALLKETYRSLLPEHLFTLPKSSFYPPVAKWLRREAAPLAEEMTKHARIRELFDTGRMETVIAEHNAHTTYNLHSIAGLIQLQHWFDTVYDA